MSESLFIPKNSNREAIYEALIPQIIALLSPEKDRIANLANLAAALREAFGFFWVGSYLDNGTELVLSAFQGPIACTRIAYTRGVCGHSFSTKFTVLVPDVELFPGHIACSSASKSEIVLILKDKNDIPFGVLDIDSDTLNDFSEIDQKYLEELLEKIKVYL
jgi:L-methionine (R)-S-oxide reductase